MKSVGSLSTTALFLWLAMFFPVSSLAQKKSVTSHEQTAIPLNQLLDRSIQRFADSTVQTERRFSDSLTAAVEVTAMKTTTTIDLFADSLIRSAFDSLDTSRKDTLHFVTTRLQREFLAFADTAKQTVGKPIILFTTAMTHGRKSYSICDSCESVSDFNDRFEQFREYVETVRDSFRDSASTLIDDRRDAFQDRFETVRDSLSGLRDQLIENRLDEIDYQRYEATRLTISTGYSSHASYRGRDNGVPQQMIAPSVEFHHSWGFSLVATTSWVDQAATSWDGAAATALYEFTAGSVFGGGLSYSHFWFSDSSRSSKAVFKNAFDANLSLNWPLVSFSLDGDLATGSASEFTLAFSASHDFEIPLTLYNKISIEPTITAVIGEQNSTLTTLRKGPKGKKVVGVTTQTNNTFGILTYELSLPVTIALGPVTLSPSLVYDVPLNVVDLSSTKPFIDVEFGVSLAFR